MLPLRYSTQATFGTRDAGMGVNDGGISPLIFHKGEMVPFYKSIIGNFMDYQDGIETNLLQLFGHPDTVLQKWFSIISGSYFCGQYRC